MIRGFLRLLILVSAVCGTATAHAVTLGFDPASQTVSVGQQVSVDVVISGLAAPGPSALGDFDIDVAFDGSILSLTTVDFGLLLGDPSLFEALTNSVPSAGTVNVSEVSLLDPADLDTLQPASFTLFTLTFDVLAPGTGPLTLSINSLGDEAGNPLAAETTTGSVTVTAVPEPSSLLLLVAALATLAILNGVRPFTRSSTRPS